MSELKQRYAINMKNKMVVACTSETLPSEESAGNIHFKEIDISVAIAIRDGKITADEVIRQIQAKVGVPSYSEMMEGMKHLNVREKDIGLESAVKGEVGPGNAEPVEIDIPRSDGGAEKTAAEKEAAAKWRAEEKARKEAEAKAAEEEKARKEAEEKARKEKEAEERAAAALDGTGGSGDMPSNEGNGKGEGGAHEANL